MGIPHWGFGMINVRKAPFAMVWNKSGLAPCAFRNNTFEAQQAADGLAQQLPGHKFIVLAGITKHWVPGATAVDPNHPPLDTSCPFCGNAMRAESEAGGYQVCTAMDCRLSHSGEKL